MKILKFYLIFAILLFSLCFIMWILGFTSSEEVINIMAKSGSALGILFLTTLAITLITKPKNRNKK